MFVGSRIEDLIEERKATKVSIYKYADISKAQLDNIINGKNTPSGNTIELIADFFKVPIDFFFDRKIDKSEIAIGHHVNGNGNKVSGDISLSDAKREIEHLKELLVEKERTIQILMNQKQ
jgi:transcriptional regulator with XRE-family HTH domain